VFEPTYCNILFLLKEIVGGMLDLPYQRWRNVRRQSFAELKQKRDQLRDRWAPFDWTHIVKQRLSQSQEYGDDDKMVDAEEEEQGEGKQLSNT
jgi:hypothetical protein